MEAHVEESGLKPKKVVKTLKVRVKDKHAPLLRRMAFETNQVWNQVNEWTRDEAREPIPGFGWVKTGISSTAFDVNKRLNGWTKTHDVEINMFVAQEASRVHHESRKRTGGSKLRWRVSGGRNRSLGWVPIRKQGCSFERGQVKFAGRFFKIWDSYGLSKYDFGAASFSEDARGRWYFNVSVEVDVLPTKGTGIVGIDPGVHDAMTCSDGRKLGRAMFYRNLEEKIAKAQRAGKKDLVRALHAKAKNRCHDAFHKFTTSLADDYAAIAMGDVSSEWMIKTGKAKSALDSGWGILRRMLEYKADARRGFYLEVSERGSTQTCSSCNKVGGNSPKGRAGLGIRRWTCDLCEAVHDRDVNAARNVAALGHERLAGGIPFL